MTSLALIVIGGGIYLAAMSRRHVALGRRSRCWRHQHYCSRGNLVALAVRLDFPWRRFFYVAKWALLAYATIAGMISRPFCGNHLRGGALVALTLSLVVFAIHVPTLIGFTVARFAEPEGPAAGPAGYRGFRYCPVDRRWGRQADVQPSLGALPEGPRKRLSKQDLACWSRRRLPESNRCKRLCRQLSQRDQSGSLNPCRLLRS